MLWIAHSSTYEDARVYQLAQILTALRESIHELEFFYTSLSRKDIPKLEPNIPHPRFFPYPNSFLERNKEVLFNYVKPLEDNATCVAFLVQMKDSSQVVVKFIDQYGSAVHEFLAKLGYAPRLRYCAPFSFPQPAQPLLPSKPGLSLGRYNTSFQDDIPDDIRKLIPADVLKPTNVIQAQTDTTFAHYPLNLSENLFSSTGANDLQPIRPIHDWVMLNKLTFTH